MWKIRCKMINIQNKENAKKSVNFLVQTDDGKSATTKEEFVMCVKEFVILIKRHPQSTLLFDHRI